jgi:hypothetical protein
MATGPVAQNSQDFTDDADGYFGGRISTDVKVQAARKPARSFPSTRHLAGELNSFKTNFDACVGLSDAEQ